MGGFWYRNLVNAMDTRNVTYDGQIKTTQHYFIHGEPERTYPSSGHSDVEHTHTSMKTRKYIPRAVEGVNLGFSQESSGYVIYTTLKKVISTNHVRFDESFPYRKQSVIDWHVKERPENQLRVDSPVSWQ